MGWDLVAYRLAIVAVTVFLYFFIFFIIINIIIIIIIMYLCYIASIRSTIQITDFLINVSVLKVSTAYYVPFNVGLSYTCFISVINDYFLLFDGRQLSVC